MKIAVIDDERPSRKELIHQILSVMPDSLIEEADIGEIVRNSLFKFC